MQQSQQLTKTNTENSSTQINSQIRRNKKSSLQLFVQVPMKQKKDKQTAESLSNATKSTEAVCKNSIPTSPNQSPLQSSEEEIFFQDNHASIKVVGLFNDLPELLSEKDLKAFQNMNFLDNSAKIKELKQLYRNAKKSQSCSNFAGSAKNLGMCIKLVQNLYYEINVNGFVNKVFEMMVNAHYQVKDFQTALIFIERIKMNGGVTYDIMKIKYMCETKLQMRDQAYNTVKDMHDSLSKGQNYDQSMEQIFEEMGFKNKIVFNKKQELFKVVGKILLAFGGVACLKKVMTGKKFKFTIGILMYLVVSWVKVYYQKLRKNNKKIDSY